MPSLWDWDGHWCWCFRRWSSQVVLITGGLSVSGSIKDPEKGKYSWKFILFIQTTRKELPFSSARILLDAKTIERKKGVVTYLQRAEDIIDFSLVGHASHAGIWIYQGHRERRAMTSIRPSSTEMANIQRTVTASMKTINNISKIVDTVNSGSLPVTCKKLPISGWTIQLFHPADRR